ncbi:TRAP transporter large permease [Brevibacillus choshinensis]|uniref:TRAP transporter large permease n=1 Tax=Brevibacillus choshinensis TaxID=54911 RepID=UPI002E224C3D|nr:TRAP transporter large permease [Brevibacillus choshinensis]
MTIALLVFIALLLLQVPIAFVLGISSIAYLLGIANFGLLESAPQRLYSGLENYSLLAIPLFMFAGELMNASGITRRLIHFAKVFVGHYRGGLAYVNVLGNMFLASIIGSASAQTAIMSRVMVPEMEQNGFSREFSAATTASAALLGPIIPPSMLFIIYGVGSGVSIGKMFLAGIIPGIILAAAFICLIAYMGYRHQFPKSEKLSRKEVIATFIRVIPALLVPLLIIGGILSGVFTATESAAIACGIALVIGIFVYRELSIKDIPKVLIGTAASTATVTLLMAMANLFGWVLAFEQVPQFLVQWMGSITESPWTFLLLVNLFLLLIGVIMDELAVMIILLPIFMPLINHFGIDPIHFGVVLCINTVIGLLTPPVGAGLFIASAVANVKMELLIKSIWPFIAAAVVVLMLLTYIPSLTLWIPEMFGTLQ